MAVSASVVWAQTVVAPDPAPAVSSAAAAPDAGASPSLLAPPAVDPPAPASAYAVRSGPACADFQPVDGGGWRALGSSVFPGPRGPVRIDAGQAIAPGAYVDGLDLAAILRRDCPLGAPQRP